MTQEIRYPLIFLCLVLLLPFAAHAGNNSSTISETNSAGGEGNNQAITAANTAITDAPAWLLSQVQLQMSETAGPDADLATYLRQHAVIVKGSQTDFAEAMLLEAIKTQHPEIAGIREETVPNTDQDPHSDSNPDPDSGTGSNSLLAQIKDGRYGVVILVGEPTQNSITKVAEQEGWFNSGQANYGEIIVKMGKRNWKDGSNASSSTLVVLISDGAGGIIPGLGNPKTMTKDNQANQAAVTRPNVALSPLRMLVPERYVPAVATGISVILLALIGLVRTVFEFKALDIGRKGQKVGSGSWFLGPLNITELLAVFGASIVLGISISWQYGGWDWANWVVINTGICLVGAIIHEITHRIFAIVFKIKVEYRFWPAGSILTLASSYLGNAFSVQAFLLEEIPEGVAKWKVGLMKLSAPVVSAIIMVTFAVLNVFWPSQVFEVIYSTSGLWAMAEILPFNGLDGKDIKEWNTWVWLAALVFIGVSYCAIML